ncbi:MAG: sterol desaturase family protein [Saprospiraceae bacterium]|nr:sterol desaturase family protein [Saprospiraceae bacterium]
MLTAIIDFFENLTALHKLIWIIACLSFFWIAEGIYPLIPFTYNKWKHSKVNLVLLASTIIINVVFGMATTGIFEWTSLHNFGIFHMVDLPLWLELVLSVMALDLIAQFIVHYLLHRVKFMWRFHMVHHSDTKVDASTGTRHHPGDFVMRETFALMAIFIFGMPVAFYLIYRILTIFCTYFTHANINLPSWFDKAISWVFISPNMHKFHHHFERPWTDTNFGNIFSIWDRLFGTLVYDNPQKIAYGLDVLDHTKADDLGYQLKLPFDGSIKTDY